MKKKANKKTTTLLVLAVAAIWGVIGLKLYTGITTDSDENFTIPKQRAVKLKTTTLPLVLDYKDPFLNTDKHLRTPKKTANTRGHSQTPVNTRGHARTRANTREHTAITWPKLVYLGQIKNLSTHKVSAMLQCNGQTEILDIGTQWQEVKLISCQPDSAQLEFQNAKKWIRKNP